MKKLFNHLCDGKVGMAFLSAYLFIFIINGLKMLFLFNVGSGDFFYKLFRFVGDYLTQFSEPINSLLSFFGFAGSFYMVVIYPALFLLMISAYGAVVQFLLHSIMKKSPKRFSVTLSILFTSAGFLYVLKLIPFLGALMFSGAFIYLTGSMISQKNLMPKWKGIALCLLPLFVVGAFIASLIFSLLGTASFF